jgi:hypothetical protein
MNAGTMEKDWRMFKYHQYCPVARACEILADRWTPLIVRELLFGSRHFNELRRGLPRISRSLLVARLRHLEDTGVIERRTGARPGLAGNLNALRRFEIANDLRNEIIYARLWGGLHYHFSSVAGVVLGRNVAKYDLRHAFRPPN